MLSMAVLLSMARSFCFQGGTLWNAPRAALQLSLPEAFWESLRCLWGSLNLAFLLIWLRAGVLNRELDQVTRYWEGSVWNCSVACPLLRLGIGDWWCSVWSPRGEKSLGLHHTHCCTSNNPPDQRILIGLSWLSSWLINLLQYLPVIQIYQIFSRSFVKIVKCHRSPRFWKTRKPLGTAGGKGRQDRKKYICMYIYVHICTIVEHFPKLFFPTTADAQQCLFPYSPTKDFKASRSYVM